MKTEEIIERLRNPQKYNSKTSKTTPNPSQKTQVATPQTHNNFFVLLLALGALIIAFFILLITLRAKQRAEDVTAALDPKQISGLTYNAEFNPNKNVTYVQIYEGQDRNVSVDELGTTLPIISRYNYQAITPKNYGIIGMAPWALTENFAANLQDADLIRYLLNREEVGKAFIRRNDVAPLLEDPQLLAAFVQDNATLSNFFGSDTVQKVLDNPALVQAISGSRFTGYLLTSRTGKYFREHPQEAAKLINDSPALSALKQNAAVRKAVSENYYLKAIAPKLLGTSSRNSRNATKK